LFKVVVNSQFKKDLKRASKREKDINKIENVVNVLQSGNNLGVRYRNHRLIGNWSAY
jgi:mRNA interferase YafQ